MIWEVRVRRHTRGGHDKVEAWRPRQPKISPKSEAIRELLRRALQVEDRRFTKQPAAGNAKGAPG